MTTDFDAALTYKLTHTSAIQAKLGTRIYPVALPTSVAFPAAVFQPISGAPINLHKEKSVLPNAIYQITVWSEDLDTAREAEAVLTAELDGFKGTWNGVSIERCVASRVPIYNRDPETLLFSVIREFTVMWRE